MTRKQWTGAGLAVVFTSTLSAFLAVRVARESRLGSIATPVGAGNCYSIEQAAAHSGENACVEGQILRVYTARSGTTFLDFCRDYRRCPFTSVIFADDRPSFGQLASLEGRKVNLMGQITTYQGKPEIVLHQPSQIRTAP